MKAKIQTTKDLELTARISDIPLALIEYRLKHAIEPKAYPMTPAIAAQYRTTLSLFAKQIQLLLSPSLRLYREPKSLYHYELRQKDFRHKIIKTLIQRSNYVDSTTLLKVTGHNSKESLYKTISNFNRSIRTKLELQNNLIEGKPSSGYRINPKYLITQVWQ